MAWKVNAKVIAFALFVAAALASPVDFKDATIIENESTNIGVGPYAYKYQTSDGKSAYEEGQLKNLGAEGEAIEVRGQYSYTGDDGIVYTITYVADENGYRPQGAHIPGV